MLTTVIHLFVDSVGIKTLLVPCCFVKTITSVSCVTRFLAESVVTMVNMRECYTCLWLR